MDRRSLSRARAQLSKRVTETIERIVELYDASGNADKARSGAKLPRKRLAKPNNPESR